MTLFFSPLDWTFHGDSGRLQARLRVHRLPLAPEPLQELRDRPRGGPRAARALPRPRERDQPAALTLSRPRERDESLPLSNARKWNQLLPFVLLDRRGCVRAVQGSLLRESGREQGNYD